MVKSFAVFTLPLNNIVVPAQLAQSRWGKNFVGLAGLLLRGKHKPTFAAHMDNGDFVIIVNAEKVVLTGDKLAQKKAYRHSGYPGGLTTTSYSDLMEKNPQRAVEKAIRGMLPKNKLGDQLIGKLKVYAGSNHPHEAQKAKPFTIDQIAQ